MFLRVTDPASTVKDFDWFWKLRYWITMACAVENSHIANTFFHHFRRDVEQRLGSGDRISQLPPAAPSTSKAKPEQVLDFAKLVA